MSGHGAWMSKTLMKRILIVFTSSPSSKLALAEGLRLAREEGGRVRLVRCARSGGAQLRNAERALERAEEMIPPKFRDGTVAIVAPVPEGLVAVAHRYDADKVVIGARTYGALLRLEGVGTRFHHRGTLVIARALEPMSDIGLIQPPLHTFWGVGSIAGGASGAIVGAIAGPPGMILGGTIGAAIGAACGDVLDSEDRRVNVHDRELDDAIGVTNGSLGIGALDDVELEGGESLAAAAALLREEHQRIEMLADALLAAQYEGDWCEMNAEWSLLEQSLRAHMDREEARVFPLFRRVNEAESAELLAEHGELRRMLDTLGVALELHAVSAAQIRELTDRLRIHKTREENLLYPWIDSIIVEHKAA